MASNSGLERLIATRLVPADAERDLHARRKARRARKWNGVGNDAEVSAFFADLQASYDAAHLRRVDAPR